jgi:hypothetical protein
VPLQTSPWRFVIVEPSGINSSDSVFLGLNDAVALLQSHAM